MVFIFRDSTPDCNELYDFLFSDLATTLKHHARLVIAEY